MSDQLLNAVRHRPWALIATLAVALGAVGLLTWLQTPRYEATATLRVATRTSLDGVVRADDLAYADRLSNTYRMILGTRPIRAQLARTLGVERAPAAEITLPANSELLEITASDADADRAAAGANALARILVDEVARPNTVTFVEPAQPPTSVASPSWPLNLAVGALIGLLGGLAVAVILERRAKGLQAIDAIEDVTQTSVLAEIPALSGDIHIYNTGSPQEEAFRALRGSLLARERDGLLHSILVTGTRAGPQATAVAANIAAALASTERQVVAVDADLRDPRLHRAFRISNGRGVSNVLQGSAEWDAVIRTPPRQKVSVITAGRVTSSPGRLLGSVALADLLAALRGRFDTTVITAPPLLQVADADLLSLSVDAVVLVLERTHARADEAARASRRLAMLGAPLIGVVLVDQSRRGMFGGRTRTAGSQS